MLRWRTSIRHPRAGGTRTTHWKVAREPRISRRVKNNRQTFAQKLDQLLEKHRIRATWVERLQGTGKNTVSEVANALSQALHTPVPESQVLRIFVYRVELTVNGKKIFHPVILAAPGDKRVTSKPIRNLFGVQSRHIQPATEQDFTTITGAKAGCSSPFPLGTVPAHKVTIVFDRNIAESDNGFYVARNPTSQYCITYSEMIKLLKRLGTPNNMLHVEDAARE